MRLLALLEIAKQLTNQGFVANYTYPFLLEEGGPDIELEERLVLPLTPPVCRIGRQEENHVSLNRLLVSGEHAEFRWVSVHGAADQDWCVTDLEATNGTFVDGARLTPGVATALHDGTVVGLGPIRFSFLTPHSLLSILRRLEVTSRRYHKQELEDATYSTLTTVHQAVAARGNMGSLAEHSVFRLFEEVDRGQQTGKLMFVSEQGQRVGWVSFRAGSLVEASTPGGLHGVQATKSLLRLERGRFVFDDKPPSGAHGLDTSFSEILRNAEQRASEHALAVSEAQLRAATQNAFHGIVTCDDEGGILFMNARAKQLFGVDMCASLDALLLDAEPGASSRGLLSEQGMRGVQELTGLRKSGETFPVEVAVTRVVVDDDTTWSLALQDLTERKQAEQDLLNAQTALQQADKMDAVGRLASGITHDFNNLLVVINGYSEMLLTTYDAEHPNRNFVEAIKAAGERGLDLTQQLLAFSRRQELNPRRQDLNAIIASLGKMLDRVLGKAELRIVPGVNVAQIVADKVKLEQVLMTLIVNARDAMPDGGRILVATQNAKVGDDIPGVSRGDYVRLTVSDTGEGMSPEVVAKIFEPFYTTKKAGTGLGLATAYGIIKQSRGHIAVRSVLGGGTTFSIYLPQADPATSFPP